MTPVATKKPGSDPVKTPVRYVIITPVRNEGENIEETIRSILAQTILPLEWIVVDDGSSDGTGAILQRYAAQYSWLRVFDLSDRGFREPGSGVIRAFNFGFRQLEIKDWDFIVKLDGDLSFASDYFEKCFDEFRQNPTLAVGGGIICHSKNGVLLPDVDVAFHVRGATKIYRRQFWDAMGGLLPVPGWDTLDELKANMLGWTTRTFANMQVLHRRPTGSADGAWRNWFKNGRANYITGYHPLFMTLKCLMRIRQKPYFLGGLALFCGFVSGYIKRVPQAAEPELIRYVRTQQIRKMLFQSSIWG